MESSGQIKFQVTLLVNLFDDTKSSLDLRYRKILLDNEVPINLITYTLNPEVNYLKLLSDKYLKYDFEYINKTLVDSRIKSSNFLELIYISNIKYMPKLNILGSIYTYLELQERNIILDEYYERLIRKFGSPY